MEYGLFYYLACDANQSPYQRYQDTIAQIELGEDLGWQGAWFSEFHFNHRLCIMPSPLLVAAAVAQRTRQMRLGTAVLSLPLSNPLRVAEDTATLDILSDGRLELGVGTGAGPDNYRGMGIDYEERRGRFEEAMDVIVEAWTQEDFSYSGKHYTVDGVNVAPKPIQKPHPPVHVASSSGDSVEFAATRGFSLLITLLHGREDTPTTLGQHLKQYRARLAECGHDPLKITMLFPTYVTDNPEEIRPITEPTMTNYLDASAYLGEAAGKEGSYHYEDSLPASIYGTPEQCVQRIMEMKEEFGFDRCISWFNAGGLIPHEKVVKSMKLFSKEVMPYVR